MLVYIYALMAEAAVYYLVHLYIAARSARTPLEFMLAVLMAYALIAKINLFCGVR